MKNLYILITILLVISFLVTGCTTSTPSTPSPDETSPDETSPEDTVTKYGGTLTILVSADTTSLYPPEQFGPEYNYQCAPALEALVYLDENANILPLLAESINENSVDKEITIKLKKGIKFHDGTDFNAQACKWNFEQDMESLSVGINFSSISSIDVVDDYTIRLNFSTWDSLFTYNLKMCQMVSPTAFEENGLEWMREHPVGTGPFKLVSWQRDVSKVYEKWDGYWQDGKPYLDKIEIRVIANAMTQITSFLAGEGDIIVGLSPLDAENLKNNSEVTISQAKLLGLTEGLMPDSASPDYPLSNLLVRQAISYAIDRQAICDSVYKGFAKPTYQLNSPVCYSNNPNIVGCPYNQERAKELLTEAGYSDGFTTTLWSRPELIYQDLYTAVQGYLSEVGIEVDLQLLDIGKYNQMYFEIGWSEGLFGTEVDASPEVGDVSRWFFDSDTSLPALGNSLMHSSEINDTVKKVNSATDFETKKALSWELQSLIFDKYCIYIPLVFLPTISAKYKNVHDEYTNYVQEAPWTFADTWIGE